MEQKVFDFLRREENNRVFMFESKNGLFECLGQHIFHVNMKNLQKMLKTFMQRDEEKLLFKNILQLLDNSGNLPMKEGGENDKLFSTRLDTCYDGITNTCTDIHPSSDFSHVYVFAIATLIGRPILILHKDEAGILSWSYFPFLYNHACGLVRGEPKYSAQNYITMFFSTDHCYMIDSFRCPDLKPTAHGCIGVYKKRLKGKIDTNHIKPNNKDFAEINKWLYIS